MTPKLKKLPILIRIFLAVLFAMGWVVVIVHYPTGLVLLSLPVDWIISGLVLFVIYNTFLNSSSTKDE